MKNFVSKLIVLPDTVKAGITAVVLYVVSFLLTNIILLVPFLSFLEQFKVPLAASIALAVLAAIEKAIPDIYETVAIAALKLVLAVLAVFGVGLQLAAQGVLPGLLIP